MRRGRETLSEGTNKKTLVPLRNGPAKRENMAEASPRTTSKRARKAPKKMSDAADEDDLDAVEEAELQEAIAVSQAEAPPMMMPPPEAPKPKPEIEEGKFYKRDLPEQCIAFASQQAVWKINQCVGCTIILH